MRAEPVPAVGPDPGPRLTHRSPTLTYLFNILDVVSIVLRFFPVEMSWATVKPYAAICVLRRTRGVPHQLHNGLPSIIS